MEKHVAIIIPGLGEIERFRLLTSHWRKYHVGPVHHRIGWHGSEHFETGLGRILARIDSFSTTGTKVSLIGCSAGGSAALNAFLERKNTVHKVISLCGWLRVGEHRKYLERLKHISASFVESVTLLDRRENELSSEDRAKIMTVRPIFDELVASDVVTLDGARNIRLPVPGHTLGIVSGLTIFSRQLIEFIRASA
jgi:pimeloyl-ACP methyl ester carboxylesterase